MVIALVCFSSLKAWRPIVTELSVELTNIRNVSHNVGPATVIVEREQSCNCLTGAREESDGDIDVEHINTRKRRNDNSYWKAWDRPTLLQLASAPVACTSRHTPYSANMNEEMTTLSAFSVDSNIRIYPRCLHQHGVALYQAKGRLRTMEGLPALSLEKPTHSVNMIKGGPPSTLCSENLVKPCAVHIPQGLISSVYRYHGEGRAHALGLRLDCDLQCMLQKSAPIKSFSRDDLYIAVEPYQEAVDGRVLSDLSSPSAGTMETGGNHITTGTVPTAVLRPLPLELWLLIIDELGAEREYDALEACAEASEGLLKERAERYIPNEMIFRKQEEVASIKMGLHWKGPERVRILGGMRRGGRLPIPHLATFASRLARKWTRAGTLTIEKAEWRVQDLDQHHLLLDLAYFNNVSTLFLYGVTFPTVLTFWRVVCTFPQLRWLHLYDVKFVRTAIDARTFSAFRLLSAPRLEEMDMLPPMSSDGGRLVSHQETDSAGLLLALLAQTVSSLKEPPWRNVRLLYLWDVMLPTAADLECLHFALPSLELFMIFGPLSVPIDTHVQQELRKVPMEDNRRPVLEGMKQHLVQKNIKKEISEKVCESMFLSPPNPVSSRTMRGACMSVETESQAWLPSERSRSSSARSICGTIRERGGVVIWWKKPFSVQGASEGPLDKVTFTYRHQFRSEDAMKGTHHRLIPRASSFGKHDLTIVPGICMESFARMTYISTFRSLSHILRERATSRCERPVHNFARFALSMTSRNKSGDVTRGAFDEIPS
ncbi:hypothetical protein IEO21_09755 [Rhodonia placenta]|uniref:F-box domain-containing protein n=1 Tax=Rhodonia placenta TaxID=104341 RepID=A0A8H7NTW6_9APHY|nr:hypothetical protein IEO21_09755 [Postia placenta]